MASIAEGISTPGCLEQYENLSAVIHEAHKRHHVGLTWPMHMVVTPPANSVCTQALPCASVFHTCGNESLFRPQVYHHLQILVHRSSPTQCGSLSRRSTLSGDL